MGKSGPVTMGLAKIEIGVIAADGGMGTTLTQLGYTSTGTCVLSTEDPTVNDFTVEELDDPLETNVTPGKMTLSFSVANPDLDALVELFGGTKDETLGTWTPPAQIPVIERSIRVTPRKGYMFEFVRMKINAKWNAQLGRDNIAVVEVTADVLIPEKADTPKYTLTKIDVA